jgi:hypothetical protein
LILFALAIAAQLDVSDDLADAAPKRAAAHGPVAIPIDVGFGPVAMIANPPLFGQQLVFSGVELSLAAVINQQLIREHENQIPAEYRAMARGIDEAEIRPWFLALVPSRLIISPYLPSLNNSIYGAGAGMYGAVWRPFGAGFTLLEKPVKVGVSGAVDLTYIFIESQGGCGTTSGGQFHCDVAAAPIYTHFLRPGVNLNLTATLPISETLLVSTGWSSDLFIPQPLGRPPWELFPLENSLWHLGGPFLMVHVRFPYEVSL